MRRPAITTSLLAAAFAATTVHAETPADVEATTATGSGTVPPEYVTTLPGWVQQRRAELGITEGTDISPPARPVPPTPPSQLERAGEFKAPMRPTLETPDWVSAQRAEMQPPAPPQAPERPAVPARPEADSTPERPTMEAPTWLTEQRTQMPPPVAPQPPERPQVPARPAMTAQPEMPARAEAPMRPTMEPPAWVTERRTRMQPPVAPQPPERPQVPARPEMTAQPEIPARAETPPRPTMEPPAWVTEMRPTAPLPRPAAPPRPAPVDQAMDMPEAPATPRPPVSMPAVPHPAPVGRGYRPGGGMPYGGWGYPGYNNWGPWGNGWGNNSWFPFGSGWSPWGSGWNDGYGSGWGDGYGRTWGDGYGDAAGDLDFDFAMRGRANMDMRGYGYGDGYGLTRGYGYGRSGYGPYAYYPAPPPAQPAPAAPSGPADGDNDGVADGTDLCPDTAAGTPVDALGCSEAARIVLRGVNFKTDSDELTDESLAILDGVASTLSAHPQIKVMVAGHTDSDGEDAYNKDLSQRRAQSVVNYLADNGVDRDNLIAMGYGEERPVADNDTAEGKAQNRRVELNRL
jgi:outer membrane protein OmpA-like peptidoglycan-associated protein